MLSILASAAKGALRVLPTNFVIRLKQSETLLRWYKWLMLETGYTGGLIPWRYQSDAYQRLLAKQEQELEHSDFHQASFSLIVMGSDSELVSTTVQSVRNGYVQPQSIITFSSLNEDLSDKVAELEDIVIVVQAGYLVHKYALQALVNSLINTKADLVYCDSDLRIDGVHSEPELYPDWSPDLQLSTGYIKSAFAFNKRQLYIEIESLAENTVSQLISQLYLSSSLSGREVHHLDLVLTHAASKRVKDASFGLDENARFDITRSKTFNSLKWKVEQTCKVSLIIPTKNAQDLVRNCIESIVKKTTYQNYEIILVDNGSDDIEALKYFDQLSESGVIRLLKYDKPFNYSAINNFAVKHANGEVIGLINNDIEVISPDWLDYMVGHAARGDVGCVGAKLLYPNKQVQHAGVVMGYGGGAGHAHKYFKSNVDGYLTRLSATNNFSAVTAACLLVKKSDYIEVGGLNETDLTVAFNDVDFCLKVKELGRNNVYCAEAQLFHHESVTRGLDIEPEKKARFERELSYLKETWGSYIENDPCYHSALTVKHENFCLKGCAKLGESSDA